MYKLIYITASDKKEAEKIIDILLQENLTACANFFPVESLYKWKGEMKRSKEIGIFLKTKDRLVDKIVKKVKELHSYDVPCVISIPIEKGNPEFLKWINKSTK